jgi:hypothetical protein
MADESQHARISIGRRIIQPTGELYMVERNKNSGEMRRAINQKY